MLSLEMNPPHLYDVFVVLGPMGKELPGCLLVVQVAVQISQQNYHLQIIHRASHLDLFLFNTVLSTLYLKGLGLVARARARNSGSFYENSYHTNS